MKGAQQCARKLAALIRSLRGKLGKVSRPPTGDPVTQIILGVLTRDAPEAKAREALDRLREMVVDYNEMRVIPPGELATAIGDYPDARTKCEDISRALNRIFAMEHTVSLDRLSDSSKAEVVGYLNALPGLEPYTRARTRALAFGHAVVPLDEAMWAYARQQGVVDAKCSLDEAQSFIERNVDESEVAEVFALFKKAAWGEMGTAVRKRQTERIRSVPPDRTSRNMLRLIQSGASLPEADPPIEEFAEAEEVAPPREEPAEEGAARDAGKKNAKSGKSARGNPARKDKKSKPSPAKPPASRPQAARKSGKNVAKARSA